MLLSELVYLAVKNVIYYDDDSFDYTSFLQGKWRNSADYGNQINNVFTPINEAVSRLSDLERLPYEIEQVNIENYKVSKNALNKPIKDIVGIGDLFHGAPRCLEWFSLGLDYYSVNGLKDGIVYIEYKVDVPTFSEKDIDYPYRADGTLDPTKEIKDVNLKEEYGINESMAQYIIEYAEGKLLEQISPELANLHINRSEAYFAGLQPQKATFVQRNVENKFYIGD